VWACLELAELSGKPHAKLCVCEVLSKGKLWQDVWVPNELHLCPLMRAPMLQGLYCQNQLLLVSSFLRKT